MFAVCRQSHLAGDGRRGVESICSMLSFPLANYLVRIVSRSSIALVDVAVTIFVDGCVNSGTEVNPGVINAAADY